MKIFVILLGIFFTCAPANAEDVLIQNFTRSYDACVKSLNVTEETVEILKKAENFEDVSANCLVYCVAEQLGIMNDTKVNFVKLEAFLKSGGENPKSVDTFMEIMKKECPTDAEQPKDKCAVAGKYAKCMKEVQTKMAEMVRNSNRKQ